MMQFYFLSVLFNVLGGYALVSARATTHGTPFEGLREFLRNGTARLILGILSLVIGALKLLTVIRGDIPVIGDLLPSLAGMAVGFTLLLEYYENEATGISPAIVKLGSFLRSRQAMVGAAGIVAAILHFLFPTVLFL